MFFHLLTIFKVKEESQEVNVSNEKLSISQIVLTLKVHTHVCENAAILAGLE